MLAVTALARDKLQPDHIAKAVFGVCARDAYRTVLVPLAPVERICISKQPKHAVYIHSVCEPHLIFDAPSESVLATMLDIVRQGAHWSLLALVPNAPRDSRLAAALALLPSADPHKSIVRMPGQALPRPLALFTPDTWGPRRAGEPSHSCDYYVDAPPLGRLPPFEVEDDDDDVPDWSHVAIAAARSSESYMSRKWLVGDKRG